jgi:5-hydroxyisourate hydrolase
MSARGISTHVLDTALGKPAEGVPVVFESADGTVLARGITDADGRIGGLLPDGVPADGTYRIRFDVQTYSAGAFFPEVAIAVNLQAGTKYHLPLLLSPFGYGTYRGS